MCVVWIGSSGGWEKSGGLEGEGGWRAGVVRSGALEEEGVVKEAMSWCRCLFCGMRRRKSGGQWSGSGSGGGGGDGVG